MKMIVKKADFGKYAAHARVSAMAVVAAGMIFALSSCSGKKTDTQEIAEEKAVTVNIQKTQPITLSDYIEFSGYVQAKNSVDMYSTVAGKITRVYVKVGDKISANQIIAEVDSSRPGAVYAASPVRSSISGTVVSLAATLGAQVSTSSVLATVGQIENLEIQMEVPERFSSLLRQNQTAFVSVPACPDETFEANVIEISPVVESTSRSTKVLLSLASDDSRIKAGMSARVHLITETLENVIAVPSRAILTNMDEKYVFVAGADKTHAQKRAVETGITVDGLTHVTSGVQEGDFLIIKGQSLIGDGQLINAVEITN